MVHNRKFVPGIIHLVKVRILRTRHMLFTHDALEKIVIDSGMLETAPFIWIGLMYRYGTKKMLNPEFRRIDKKDGELAIAVELDATILKWADEYNLQFFKDIYMIAGLEALLHVCDKYKLPKEHIQAERAKYGDIPDTVEECEKIYGRDPKD